MSDFHLLLYLTGMEIMPLMKLSMMPLLNAVRTKDTSLAMQWKEDKVWTTLEALITKSDDVGYGN